MFSHCYHGAQFVVCATKLISHPTITITALNKVSSLLPIVAGTASLQCRFFNRYYTPDSPVPGDRKYNYKHLVKYPKDGKYTIEHLPIVLNNGRNPTTGMKVERRRRGGRNTNFRWIDYNRMGPEEKDQFKEEQIIEVQYDPNRTAFIALVGSGSHLRYVMATTSMKIGETIQSSNYLPEIPTAGSPGNSYPIGALPVGTSVCHVETLPGHGATRVVESGSQAIIKRKLPDGKIVLELRHKHELALDPRCNVVCGQVSNVGNSKIHIGSMMRLRWLGYAPRSGLWHRKDGYCGKKIKALPPIRHFKEPGPEPVTIELKCWGEGPNKPIVPRTRRNN